MCEGMHYVHLGLTTDEEVGSFSHTSATLGRFQLLAKSDDMFHTAQHVLINLAGGSVSLHMLNPRLYTPSAEVQVIKATEFLARMHPLKHVAPVRKSQVQHAISEMLTIILKTLVLDRPSR